MIRTSLAILLVAASAGLGDRVPDDPAARGARSALRPAYGPFHQFRHPLATFAGNIKETRDESPLLGGAPG